MRRDLGHVALLPGLVNAHTHLELSWLRGRVPPARDFVDWIKQLFATARRRRSDPDDPERASAAAREAAREARESGTAAVGDISNSLASVEPIAEAGLHGLVFHELLGFNVRDGKLGRSDTRPAATAPLRWRRGVRVSVAPHAPYSVSPELFRAIRGGVDRVSRADHERSPRRIARGGRVSGDGTGAVASDAQRGRSRGARTGTRPACGPVEYLDRSALLDARTLVVHGVQLDDAAWRGWPRSGATLVTCPRSNQWVGVGVPPIERFYRSGVHGGGWHRQPGQRRGSEPLQRAEDDAVARARRCRPAAARERDARSAPRRWALATSSARSTPGKRAR